MREVIRKRVTRRLKIIEGQVRGLQRMVGAGAYCIDVIIQSAAVKEALSGVEDVLLKNHLETHVVDQVRSGRERQAVAEVLKVCRAARRR